MQDRLPTPLELLRQDIQHCRLCPRLTAHCQQVAMEKRRAYRNWDYWGQPVPGWGDPEAELLVVGLAPGAHGANRTGRMFTGDRSGDFLYRALWETGFASQASSTHREDGLTLRNVWITASARCAPPGNRPQPEELNNCFPFLVRELDLLRNLRLVLVLGGIAAGTYLRWVQQQGEGKPRSAFPFGHGRLYTFRTAPPMLCSYHPSQQNTSTGRLTADMLRAVFATAAGMLQDPGFSHLPRSCSHLHES